MSIHVLLNLLNELRKRDKMRGLPSSLSLFRNELNKFNNTAARMLDSIYHIKLKLLKDICGYFQCAPFPRLQTGKVVWVLSFDP